MALSLAHVSQNIKSVVHTMEWSGKYKYRGRPRIASYKGSNIHFFSDRTHHGRRIASLAGRLLSGRRERPRGALGIPPGDSDAAH